VREYSGGEGIRTLKSLRTPVFETGALPFCHPSEGLITDGVGFEPTRHLHAHTLSRRAP
jgi:hypothetical protein